MNTSAPRPTMTSYNVLSRGGARSSLRTVLITGVSKGLGRALALEMARHGHAVIGCSRSDDKLAALKSELSDSKHLFVNVDIRVNSSVEELLRMVMEKKGAPDIIVNNAGTINKNNKIWEVPEEEFDAVMDTNVKGTVNVLRHFLPPMIERKQGIIVNFSSGWGRSGAALLQPAGWNDQVLINSLNDMAVYPLFSYGVAPYCASKWAIEGLTKSVAKELPEGMAIVALNPGVINTDMLTSCFGSSASIYQAPDAWAVKAAAMILNLTRSDNGASLTV